jgi:ribonucleoside-diphosphate reductase alpha chain
MKAKSKPIETLIPWKKFDSKIVDVKGQVIFEMKNIEAPATWSQTAVDIVASKYFYKGHEKSVRQLVTRISNGLETAITQSKIFKTKKEIKTYIDEIKLGLYRQEFAFNSPVWFNCGLSETYKAKSASDQHYALNFKNKKIEPSLDVYKRPQSSACFIQSIDDSMESIFDLLKTEAMLFKFGSGTGTNFTNLRSRFENLKSGGTSSGLISFLEIFDKSAGSIKSGGVTRRAAKMVCLDMDHPEILDFIEWKKKEEKKARVLVEAGYEGSLDGEVYRTISGQNSNNSVRVTDQFMQQVLKDGDWNLKYPSTGKVHKTVKAKELWNSLCESAWECADPGVQFHDTINKFHMSQASGEIRASNPCSEFMYLDNTACNLASLNLIKFYQDGIFNTDKFSTDVDRVFKAQDAIVDYSSYPTKQIAENSYRHRPIGLGFANLGSLLMLMGIPYDSDHGRAWAGMITAMMTAQCYFTSSEIARIKTPFAEYSKNKKSALAVLAKQMNSVHEIDWSLLPEQYKQATYAAWMKAVTHVKKHGLRNSQVTVIAPTGTIGLVMDCGTTGIEPDYSLVKNKKLSGGGQLRIVNESLEKVLKNLQYSDRDLNQIIHHIVNTGSVISCAALKPEHRAIFQTAQGDNKISSDGHLMMMAAVQPFISGAISKTVNLPSEANVADISDVYMKAWKLNLKSVSLYRDQSKFVQPLSDVGQKCVVCGHITVLESGCYKCHNCGFVSACVG